MRGRTLTQQIGRDRTISATEYYGIVLLLFPSFSTTFLSLSGCFPAFFCSPLHLLHDTTVECDWKFRWDTCCLVTSMRWLVPFAIPSLIFTHTITDAVNRYITHWGWEDSFLTVPYLAIGTTFCYNYDHTNTFLVPRPQSDWLGTKIKKKLT